MFEGGGAEFLKRTFIGGFKGRPVFMKISTCTFIPACTFIVLQKNSHLYVYSHLYYYSALRSNFIDKDSYLLKLILFGSLIIQKLYTVADICLMQRTIFVMLGLVNNKYKFPPAPIPNRLGSKQKCVFSRLRSAK